MNRDERFYAFIVSQTSRSRSYVRRVSIHKRWVKASVMAVTFLLCAAAYGVYKSSYDIVFIVTIVIVGGGLLALLFLLKSRYSQTVGDEQVNVPQLAESLIHLLSPQNSAENILGDLQEELERLVRRIGPLRAKFWLYRQLVNSALPLIYSRARQLITRVAKAWKRS